jgi:hypothetical protein
MRMPKSRICSSGTTKTCTSLMECFSTYLSHKSYDNSERKDIVTRYEDTPSGVRMPASLQMSVIHSGPV